MKTIKCFLVIFACVVFFNNTSHASDFKTLISSGKLKCSVQGNEKSVHYAKPLLMKLTNESNEKLDFTIPAGYFFSADDTSFQNIVITNSLIVQLPAKNSATYELFGMCMESNDKAPTISAFYKPAGMAEPGLVKLAQFIEKKKFFSPAGQQAVWTYIDDKPLYAVTSLDDNQAVMLQEFLTELTGKPLLKFSEDDAYMYNYSTKPKNVEVGGEINIKVSYKMNVEWSLFDENGILLRELYNGTIGPGEVKLTFSYDAKVYTDPVYYLKLVADGEIIYKRKLSFEGIE